MGKFSARSSRNGRGGRFFSGGGFREKFFFFASVFPVSLSQALCYNDRDERPGKGRENREGVYTTMKTQLLNHGWRFRLGLPGAFLEDDWRDVRLPHDFMLGLDTKPDAPAGPASGFYPGAAGTYERTLGIPAQWEGETILLRFDGVYRNAAVSLNGSRLAFHPYGYSPFTVDLTPQVRFGQPNRLEVTVDTTAQPSCRWYSGAGIYRSVELLHGAAQRIAPWGFSLRTEALVDGDALVLAEVTVQNDENRARPCRVTVTLSGPDGEEASAFTSLWLAPQAASTARVRVNVPQARLWSPDAPALYTARAAIDCGGVTDGEETAFGVRTVTVDAAHGLRVNGVETKLRGGCMHHVTGITGAASFPEQDRRMLLRHKQAGYNAVRCAHNPPSSHFLDLCDELGILVIDEAFDGWAAPKQSQDYHTTFADWWQRDLDAMILRDRNHPSVILWSTGNEVYERAGCGDGFAWAQRLAAEVRRLDPSRPVINALCSLWNGLSDEDNEAAAEERRRRLEEGGTLQNFDGEYTARIWADRTEPFAAPLDVVGYNYMEDRYEPDHERFPDRVICGTESVPFAIDKIWAIVKRCPHVIGDFTWTSADYLGEAGIGCCFYHAPDDDSTAEFHLARPFPWRAANDADWDLCGFERPQLAYRRIVWGSDETFLAVRDPAHFGMREDMSFWGWPIVSDRWTWPGMEGRPVAVDVYSPGEEVELFLNGRSLGRSPAGEANRFTARFTAPYEPGVLEAVSYRGGAELSRARVETAGAPARLVLLPEQDRLVPDGLLFVAVEVQDAEGRRVPWAEPLLTASAEGDASLLSFGSAQPLAVDNYTVGSFHAWEGRALAVLRAAPEAGQAVLRVSCEGLPEAAISLRS